MFKTVKEIIKEHIEWRRQIIKLAKSDIIKTYSGAALGWAWAIVKPTITILVFWFAFSVGLRQGGDKEGFPYILWLVAGFVPWFYMQEMIPGGTRAIRRYKYLVTKMKFPVSTIPTFVNLAKLSVHLCMMVIVVVLFMAFRHFPTVYWLQIPFYMLCMFLFFVMWSLFASMLASMSRDFQNLVKSFTTAIFWLSGIMWDINSIDIPWVQTVLKFNPVTFVATGYRNCLIYQKWVWEDWSSLGAFAVTFTVMAVLAVWCYKKLRKEIPDVL